jgi:hypothetical protein
MLRTRRIVVAGMIGAALGAGAGAGAPTAAAPGDSVLILRAPERLVVESGDGYIGRAPGLRLEAPNGSVEIWSNRDDYDSSILSVWKTPTGDLPLPTDAMTSFRGFNRFLHVTITRVSDGQVVKDYRLRVCLNDYGPQRIDPDSVSRSRYPYGCSHNRYVLGSVMGIESGWAAATLEARRVRLGYDRYELEATITDAYAEVGNHGRSLRFSATVWNAGDAPLVVDGFRRPGEDAMDAYQYFFDADGNETATGEHRPGERVRWTHRDVDTRDVAVGKRRYLPPGTLRTGLQDRRPAERRVLDLRRGEPDREHPRVGRDEQPVPTEGEAQRKGRSTRGRAGPCGHHGRVMETAVPASASAMNRGQSFLSRT